MGATEARKRSPVKAAYDIAGEDDMYESRSHSSARRYKQPIHHETLDDPTALKGVVIQPRRSSIAQPAVTSVTPKAASASFRLPFGSPFGSGEGEPCPPATIADKKRRKAGSRRLPALAVVLGMLVMGLLVIGATSFSSWWQIHQDDTRYGRPRTYQLDAIVGHGDGPGHPTHLIFLNLNRHVEIIELPGGDASHAHIYQGPVLYGPGQDLTPVTGEIRDVNGDGRPDVIVHIQDQQLILINAGSQFRPQQMGDHVNI
jgi:hypothetical protein